MIFDERDESARRGDCRVVERERKAERAVLFAIAKVRTARLEVAERRARVRLAVRVSSGHPRFDFVLSRLAETDLAGARDGDAIRNLELLQDLFGVVQERVVLFFGD